MAKVQNNGKEKNHKLTYFVMVDEVPCLGECMKNYLRYNSRTGNWERFLSSSKITKLEVIEDTYIVHTSRAIYFAKMR